MKSERIINRAVECLECESDAIRAMISRLDETFLQAVEAIRDCKGKVVVTGVGKSGHIGSKIAATLASTGVPAFFLNPLDAYHGDLGMLGEEDIVLAISYSGATEELLRFLPLIQAKKIRIIGMSGNPESLLARYSDIHLNIAVEREADPLNLIPTASTTATLALGDALACALVRLRDFQAQDFAQFHPGGSLGKRLLSRARDYMVSHDLPIVKPETKVVDAIITISNGKLGLAIVMDSAQQLLGIITDGDVRRAVQRYGREMFDLAVTDIMTPNPKTIRPDANLSEVDTILRRYNIHALIVTDEKDRVVSIIDSFRVMS